MKYKTKTILFSGLIFSILLFTGCGKTSQQPQPGQGHMDTPAFHVQRGDEALLSQRYESARSSFQRALNLDSNHSQALSGMAVASAYEASKPGKSKNIKQIVLEKSNDQIDKSLDTAVNKSDRARAHSFAIQVHLALKFPKNEWYKKASDHFEEAVELMPNSAEPFFFMARAESVKLNYAKATKLYHKVLSIGKKYEKEANNELKKIQQIQRAMPGSQFGAQIANVDKITRADVAALFIAELKLDKLYENRGKKPGSSYSPPKSQQRFKTDPLQKFPAAVDISGHPLEDAIKDVIKLGVKGLSPDPAHKFYPDQEFKRAEFAQLIQDILIKITKEESMATMFIGQRSIFPDVDESIWYYNAARVVTSRGLMEVKNKATGAFSPMETVRGADALLTIRSMKEILKAYLR